MPNNHTSFFDIVIRLADRGGDGRVGHVDTENKNIVRLVTEFLLMSSGMTSKIQALCGFAADKSTPFKRELISRMITIGREGGLQAATSRAIPTPVMFQVFINDLDKILSTGLSNL